MNAMTPPAETTIREFDLESARDATAFRLLNEEWLNRYFVVEPDDHLVLGDPAGQILRPGGAIFFAETGARIVGCCALIKQPDDPRVYEVAKLAVTAAFQGRQIGRKLMEFTIAKARMRQANRLILVTNSGLRPARQLYESLGFTYLAPAEGGALGHYERGDTFMSLNLG